jgi:DNA-binding GntR family transcriptional regulator
MNAFTTKKGLAKEQLLQAIRAGRYQPGARLRQNEIARDLGLSSTPVREALTDLIGCGLVTYEQHCGVRVAKVEPEQMRQVYHARKLIEREISRLAFRAMNTDTLGQLTALADEMDAYCRAGHIDKLMAADETFHTIILEACGNPYLVAAAQHLWDGFPRYFIWLSEGRMAQSMGEHRRMVEALAEGDEEGFVDMTVEHLENSLAKVLAYVAAQTVEAEDAHNE